MRQTLRLTILASLLSVVGLGQRSATADFLSTTTIQSLASSNPYPGTSGTHFHSALGQPVEVGSYSTSEEVRGVAEFALAGQPLVSSALLSFSVARLGSSYFGQSGPGSYGIRVVAYAGDNTISLGDYSAIATAVLGSFNTANMTQGMVFTFDATTAFNLAIAGSQSLGIRLELTSNPGNNVANQFSNFSLTTTASAVPEPASLVMLSIGVVGLLGANWRRRHPVAE